MQRVHEKCPNFILKPLQYTSDAHVEVPNNLPTGENDVFYAQYRTGTTVRKDVQSIALELCKCDLFDLLEEYSSGG